MVANIGLQTKSAAQSVNFVLKTATNGIKNAGGTTTLALAGKNELAKTGTTALQVIKEAGTKSLSKGKIAALITAGVAGLALIASAVNDKKEEAVIQDQPQKLYA